MSDAAQQANYPLFPEIEPYRTGTLAVDNLHTLYWEECGNPDGQPVLFLHGGTGAVRRRGTVAFLIRHTIALCYSINAALENQRRWANIARIRRSC